MSENLFKNVDFQNTLESGEAKSASLPIEVLDFAKAAEGDENAHSGVPPISSHLTPILPTVPTSTEDTFVSTVSTLFTVYDLQNYEVLEVKINYYTVISGRFVEYIGVFRHCLSDWKVLPDYQESRGYLGTIYWSASRFQVKVCAGNDVPNFKIQLSNAFFGY